MSLDDWVSFFARLPELVRDWVLLRPHSLRVGDHGDARERIEVGGSGIVEFQAERKRVRNVGKLPIESGQHCRIVKIRGDYIDVSSDPQST